MRWLTSWTIHKAAGIGSVAGLVGLLLWPAFAAWPAVLLPPFVAMLVTALSCGVSMLWITARDLTRPRGRGNRLRPIRTFDVVLALLLTAPSLIELRAIVPPYLAGFGF